MVAAVVAVRTAAIVSSIALRMACDAQLPSAIFSARALSSRLDRPCCPGVDDLVLALERAEGRSARRSGCPAPPDAPAPGSPAGAPPPRGWHLELATGGPGRHPGSCSARREPPRCRPAARTASAAGSCSAPRAPQMASCPGRRGRSPAPEAAVTSSAVTAASTADGEQGKPA